MVGRISCQIPSPKASPTVKGCLVNYCQKKKKTDKKVDISFCGNTLPFVKSSCQTIV